jgi:hypothetical protein
MIKEFEQSNGKKLQLAEDALTHITQGNFVIRPMKNEDDMTVLSGGLHTYGGWIEFKKKYSGELEHLHLFNSHKHKYWYYARELGNGVITLRIPRILFTGKASNTTMPPDNYYKSGYLWKTLFPKNFDKENIIEVIEEALKNEDVDQRQNGQIVGYIRCDDPLLKMKVVIQYQGKVIKSVFPAWSQPNSGNNGKPFSHYENIGFIIAQSTEYFDDKEKTHVIPQFTFTGIKIRTEQLHYYTPSIFTSRLKIKANESPQAWAMQRKKELKDADISPEENDLIFKYLNDFALVKYYPEMVSGVYRNAIAIKELSANIAFFNTFQVVQNFVDGLNYLYLHKQYDRLIETIVYMLDNMVSHTNFDLLSKKKIISTITNIVVLANLPELSYKFVKAISHSPIRREGYLEYNLDSLNKKKLNVPIDSFPDELVLVKQPNLDIKVTYWDFIEICKEILGETYTLNFNDDHLNELLGKVITEQSDNFKLLVLDSLDYFTSEDFTSLHENIGDILISASKYDAGELNLLITYTGLILRDYCKIQFAHRQRINARYLKYHDFANTMYLPIDHELLYGMILKHERWINVLILEEFTKQIIDFAVFHSNNELKNDAENFRLKIGKESPPLPERHAIAQSKIKSALKIIPET